MNPSTKHVSPLKLALTSLFSPAGELDRGLAVYDYASPEDFERLWNFPRLPPHRRFIIVWTKTTIDPQTNPVNATGALTPVDWAVAYVASTGTPPADWPNVLILDLDPAEHADLPSVGYLAGLRLEETPWLRLQAEVRLSEVVGWATLPLPRDAQRCAKALGGFLNMVRSNLTHTEANGDYDHHSISNLIGPMLLRGAVAKVTRHSVALIRLCQACGLAPSAAEVAEMASADVEVDPDSRFELPAGSLDVVLVDDQAGQGWADWVRESLPDIRLSVFSDPTALVQKIESELAAADRPDARAKDLRFRMTFPAVASDGTPVPSSGNRTTVLLLDLRLFSGELQRERAFFKDVLCPLILARFTDREDVAWPSFKRANAAFGAALAAVESGTLTPDTPEHREALTWLPRLLALADMSLPIVLFSSTDRKALITPLIPYRNVFVSFQKPTLFSLNNPLTRPTTLAQFRKTMNTAIAFGQVRLKCLALHALTQSVSYAPGERLDRLYVELYVDETGDPDDEPGEQRFAVGGVFAVFAGPDDADEFEDTCVRNGLRYFEDALFEPHADTVLIKYRDNGVRELLAALNAFRSTNRHVALGYVRLQRDPRDSSLAGDERDALVHEMLSALVELFCAESLPAISSQYSVPIEHTRFSIYLGTRMVPLRQGTQGSYTYKGSVPIYSLGRHHAKKPHLRSIGERDAFPIVRDILLRHKRLPLASVERAIAMSLPYKDTTNSGTKERIDRVIHRRRERELVCDFDVFQQVDIGVRLPAKKMYGTVDTQKEHQIFVSVPGERDNVFCPAWACGDRFRDFVPGTRVRLDVELAEQGYRGLNVQIVADEEMEAWVDAHTPRVASYFLDQYKSQVDDWRPDYRALHYVADQIMRSDAALESFSLCVPRSLDRGVAGQFDSVWNAAGKACELSGRALDAGELADALRLVSVMHAAGARPPAAAYLARRLWTALATCMGNKLWADSAPAGQLNPAWIERPRARAAGTTHRPGAGLPPSVPRTMHAPGPAPTPHAATACQEFQRLKRAWRIRRFPHAAAYLASGEAWHTRGFQVRQSSTGKITVFARVDQVVEADGFIEPNNANLFVNGQPGGRPYQPPK